MNKIKVCKIILCEGEQLTKRCVIYIIDNNMNKDTITVFAENMINKCNNCKTICLYGFNNSCCICNFIIKCLLCSLRIKNKEGER